MWVTMSQPFPLGGSGADPALQIYDRSGSLRHIIPHRKKDHLPEMCPWLRLQGQEEVDGGVWTS